jgi:trk system potassium uptake protein TrkA
MRVAFVGAGEMSLRTAELLIARGHEVIIIETSRDKIDEITDDFDCSFLHGDGSKPAIFREVGPEQTDALFCLTDNDQANLIASLVGRSLGFKRVITRIQDPEFEVICRELGLQDTILPSRTIGRYLADMLEGVDILELSTVIRGEARFYTFTAREEDAGAVADLDLPEKAKVVCFYREGRFSLADDQTKLRENDEVIILTHSENLPSLKERWEPRQEEPSDG